jgi:hypothetical protein
VTNKSRKDGVERKEKKCKIEKISIGEERQGFTQNKIDSSFSSRMFKLRNASSNTQVRRHGFGTQVSRENGTMKLVKAASRQCSSTQDDAL